MEGYIWLAFVAAIILLGTIALGIWIGKKIGKSIAERNDAKLKSALERDMARLRATQPVSASRQSMASSQVNRAYPNKLTDKHGSKGVATRVIKDSDVEFDEDDFDDDLEDLMELNREGTEADRDYLNKWTADEKKSDDGSDLLVALGAGAAIGAAAAVALSEEDDDPMETVEECTRSFAESVPEPEAPQYESAPEPSYDSGSSFDSGDSE
ncbi:hypothetical protein SM033_00063 [Vibrio phage vB_VpaM_sm033]|nr:hypothetical protein SM033_00063 [Vibrio phage vB_VpaM_sm033]